MFFQRPILPVLGIAQRSATWSPKVQAGHGFDLFQGWRRRRYFLLTLLLIQQILATRLMVVRLVVDVFGGEFVVDLFTSFEGML